MILDKRNTLFHQLLEEDMIRLLAEKYNIEMRQAMDIYYKSRLAEQIEAGEYNIDCLSPHVLVEDLLKTNQTYFRI